MSESVPSPRLNLVTAKDHLTLSWVIPSRNFVLQEGPDLSGTNWSDLTLIPSLNYSQLTYEMKLPTPFSTTFYRLILR